METNKKRGRKAVSFGKVDEYFDALKDDSMDKINIRINIVDIKSIYKPYWIADFRGRNIFIDY